MGSSEESSGSSSDHESDYDSSSLSDSTATPASPKHNSPGRREMERPSPLGSPKRSPVQIQVTDATPQSRRTMDSSSRNSSSDGESPKRRRNFPTATLEEEDRRDPDSVSVHSIQEVSDDDDDATRKGDGGKKPTAAQTTTSARASPTSTKAGKEQFHYLIGEGEGFDDIFGSHKEARAVFSQVRYTANNFLFPAPFRTDNSDKPLPIPQEKISNKSAYGMSVWRQYQEKANRIFEEEEIENPDTVVPAVLQRYKEMRMSQAETYNPSRGIIYLQDLLVEELNRDMAHVVMRLMKQCIPAEISLHCLKAYRYRMTARVEHSMLRHRIIKAIRKRVRLVVAMVLHNEDLFNSKEIKSRILDREPRVNRRDFRQERPIGPMTTNLKSMAKAEELADNRLKAASVGNTKGLIYGLGEHLGYLLETDGREHRSAYKKVHEMVHDALLDEVLAFLSAVAAESIPYDTSMTVAKRYISELCARTEDFLLQRRKWVRTHGFLMLAESEREAHQIEHSADLIQQSLFLWQSRIHDPSGFTADDVLNITLSTVVESKLKPDTETLMRKILSKGVPQHIASLVVAQYHNHMRSEFQAAMEEEAKGVLVSTVNNRFSQLDEDEGYFTRKPDNYRDVDEDSQRLTDDESTATSSDIFENSRSMSRRKRPKKGIAYKSPIDMTLPIEAAANDVFEQHSLDAPKRIVKGVMREWDQIRRQHAESEMVKIDLVGQLLKDAAQVEIEAIKKFLKVAGVPMTDSVKQMMKDYLSRLWEDVEVDLLEAQQADARARDEAEREEEERQQRLWELKVVAERREQEKRQQHRIKLRMREQEMKRLEKERKEAEREERRRIREERKEEKRRFNAAKNLSIEVDDGVAEPVGHVFLPTATSPGALKKSPGAKSPTTPSKRVEWGGDDWDEMAERARKPFDGKVVPPSPAPSGYSAVSVATTAPPTPGLYRTMEPPFYGRRGVTTEDKVVSPPQELKNMHDGLGRGGVEIESRKGKKKRDEAIVEYDYFEESDSLADYKYDSDNEDGTNLVSVKKAQLKKHEPDSPLRVRFDSFHIATPSPPIHKRTADDILAVMNMTTPQVCKWLDSIGLEELHPVFEEHLIDGRELMQLDNNTMREKLGITSFGTRQFILDEIRELMHSVPHEDESIGTSIFNEAQVCEWLTGIGMSHYRENFKKNNIDGRSLMKLTEAKLKNELDIVEHGDRQTILRAIEELPEASM